VSDFILRSSVIFQRLRHLESRDNIGFELSGRFYKAHLFAPKAPGSSAVGRRQKVTFNTIKVSRYKILGVIAAVIIPDSGDCRLYESDCLRKKLPGDIVVGLSEILSRNSLGARSVTFLNSLMK